MNFRTPEAIRERSDAYRRQMESTNPKQPGYTMGSNVWPGLAKLMEEAGEAVTAAAKIMAVHGSSTYYHGEDLKRQLEEELADLAAAMNFVVMENGLDLDFIVQRTDEKYERYNEWKATNQ